MNRSIQSRYLVELEIVCHGASLITLPALGTCLRAGYEVVKVASAGTTAKREQSPEECFRQRIDLLRIMSATSAPKGQPVLLSACVAPGCIRP